MGLNEAQKDAVLHKDGPCLVLAGPGSGKTLTIVNRVKYLIEGYKVRGCRKIIRLDDRVMPSLYHM